MLNGVVQSVSDANERSIKTLQPYQFLWLAHWKRTDCDVAGETSCLNASVNHKLDCMPRKDGLTKILEASSRSVNGLGMLKNRTSEIGDDFIEVGRKSVGKERIFSSLFKDGQYADDVQVLSPELAQNLKRSKVVQNRIEIPSSRCYSVEKDTSDSPPKLMKTCFARKDSLFRFNPLQLESSSHNLPYKFAFEVDKFNKGKAAISGDECLRERNSCGHSLSMSNMGRFMEMQKSPSIRLCPSQSNPSEEHETTRSHDDCYSQLKLQKCGHGLGKMRICTDVDVSGSPNTFRSGRDFTKINGDISDLPFFGKKKVKQWSRCSLNDAGAKERNELLAETDAMSMDPFKNDSKKNLNPASNSTVSAKTLKMVLDEVTGQHNHKAKVKYNSSLDEYSNADGGSRWVKRLKLSSSYSSIQETNNSEKISRSYHEQRSKLFSHIPKSQTTSSRQNVDKYHCERSLKDTETTDEKGNALLVSHGWIRRWRRIESKENSEVEKFQKGQFPSIAAMALMAKALTYFQQCELNRKGSCTVWKTKTLS